MYPKPEYRTNPLGLAIRIFVLIFARCSGAATPETVKTGHASAILYRRSIQCGETVRLP
jgi:hypothetical protein